MKRIYETLLADHFAHNRQMTFLSGPRQVGKTTLARHVCALAGHIVPSRGTGDADEEFVEKK